MILKRHITLTFLYVVHSICKLHMANCESLTDVCNYDFSKYDKAFGWTFILGTALFCGYLIYKGIYPSDSTGLNIQGIYPVLPREDKPASYDKTYNNIDNINIGTLKDSPYLKFLQEITKYN